MSAVAMFRQLADVSHWSKRREAGVIVFRGPTQLRERRGTDTGGSMLWGGPAGCSTVHPDNSLHSQLMPDSLGSTRSQVGHYQK